MSNQGNLSPRYIEVGPDGRILRQSDTIPSEVEATYLNAQQQSNVQWSNYPHQSSKNKQWWSMSGQFNPYRTSYQDYGPNNPKAQLANVVYSQAYNYNSNSNSSGTPFYSSKRSQ